MSKADVHTYDAIIIGAGIGGLVCGCYLAKAGMKVLIAEQHHTPGGYCTSFRRGTYLFDAAPHCFGSYREDGLMRKILQGLDVDKRLNIYRPDPSDTVVTPGYRVSFHNDMEKTIQGFQECFPQEGVAVRKFFHLLQNVDPKSFAALRKLTFKQLLDQYFADDKIKAILSIPLLGINGLPPSLLSAFVGAKLYSEFLFDGGYVPQGGMQALSDAIAARFQELGGELRLSTLVKKISMHDGAVSGVLINNDDFKPSRYVISNCDARQTFLSLLGKEAVTDEFNLTLKNMTPTMSNFIVYLGMSAGFDPPLNPGTFYYYLNDYNVEGAYHAIYKGDHNDYNGFAIRISPDKSTIYTGMPANYKSPQYWKLNKYDMLERFISKIEETAIPKLSQNIMYKDAATPHTLNRYTLNYHGASYGWAGTPTQIILSSFRKPPFIRNLYFVGHWTTFGVGISGVAYVGYDTALNITKRDRKKAVS